MKVTKLLAVAALPAVALGAIVTIGGTASARPVPNRPAILPSGTVKVTPHTDLVDGEKVKVVVSGIGGGGAGSTPSGIFVGQCDSRAAAGAQNPGYCDRNLADGANSASDTDGSGTFTITIHTGKDFRAVIPSAKCSYLAAGHACILVAANDPNAPTQAALTTLSFGTPTATKVTASKKKAKAKTLIAFSAKTTHKAKTTKPVGTVTFYDNGKKFAVVKETKTGVVKAKHRILAGKNKITASYSGDANDKASKSAAVVVVGTKAKK